MNFTHLLAFYEVARAGSVSAGAERLHVSQPAVTREIRELSNVSGWSCSIVCRVALP
ncbi:LysR family transcriptional regulator [Burkholderia gladioli]|uniref:LysR family transcriptional regulator n=1 Tax=Burkholderia gladioli TaxID=28095 RepID=UPI003EE27D2C